MQKIKYICGHLLVLLVAACNPDEKIPAYLSIDDISLALTNPAVEGSGSEKITDAWVYIDGKLLGVYELPARFPVLEEGTKDVLIGAGIMENGIAATRALYPFYRGYQAQAEFIPGATVSLPATPVVSYFSGVNFPWKADFENGIVRFRETSSSNVKINLVSDPSLKFEGTHSAFFKVHSDSMVFDGESDDSLFITSNQQTWLEMNYKSGQSFDVGMTVVAVTGARYRHYLVTVNPSDTWNKIYINLSAVINSNPSTSHFRLYIQSVLDENSSEGTVYLDNLKIVYI